MAESKGILIPENAHKTDALSKQERGAAHPSRSAEEFPPWSLRDSFQEPSKNLPRTTKALRVSRAFIVTYVVVLQ
jgi:hypothetical protein